MIALHPCTRRKLLCAQWSSSDRLSCWDKVRLNKLS